MSKAVWELVARQHGVVARWQLLQLGLTPEVILHRLATSRLHRVYRGVYVVGRPQLTLEGRWMAAVLACGSQAVLSHRSAATLWGLRDGADSLLEVSVPLGDRHRRKGITVHSRHPAVLADATRHRGIPITSAVRTLLDAATYSSPAELEAMVNRADRVDLLDPDQLRSALHALSGERGVRTLRTILDRRTFALTDSQLERLFLTIARHEGLPLPLTRQRVNGFRVDFYWPDLALVVETDGLRYHRTPAQQARDRLRDQAHTVAGMETLRYTHAQIRFEPRYVGTTLRHVVERLRQARPRV